jgi:hypothetical protein
VNIDPRWRERGAASLLFAVGVINVLPIVVLFVPERAHDLYGVLIEGAAFGVLMRHRAVLLAILGLLLIGAAFRTAWRVPAIAAAVISKVTFLTLMRIEAPGTGPLDRIAAFDIGALLALATVIALMPSGRASG